MKNKFSTIYAIFASVIFVLAIFYFGFNLYSEYSHGYSRTKKTFDELTLSIKKNPSDIKIKNLNDYAYIEMLKDGNSFYVYPSKDAKNNSSSLIKNWFTSVKIGDKNYFITADMYLLRPSSIRFYARNAFFIVLIVVIITIIMIITISANEKNKQKDEESKTDEEPSLDDLSSENGLNNNDIEDNQNSQKEDAILENSENQAENLNKNDENQQIADEKVENQNSTETTNEEKSEIVEKNEKLDENNNENHTSPEKEEKITLPSDEIKPQEIKINDNNPYGLFSPRTGIGWESYLLTRLDNELNRAISLESDLAVFVIKVEEIEKDEQKLKDVCNYLISQFQFKDMLFEYKEDCIVALKTSVNLDEAINLADKLHSDIEDISSLKCYIGISTRTIRIITGERLLQEATEALQHAQEEKDAPIIAFRANAEKYREFLEKE